MKPALLVRGVAFRGGFDSGFVCAMRLGSINGRPAHFWRSYIGVRVCLFGLRASPIRIRTTCRVGLGI